MFRLRIQLISCLAPRICAVALATLFVCTSAGAGTVNLQWSVANANDDGTPLTDISSQRVDYGQADGGPYPSSVVLSATATTTTLTVPTGTWCFVVLTLDSAGQVSRMSAQQTKVVP